MLADDLPLETRQQPLSFGQSQTEMCVVAEIIGPIDLHDVRVLLHTLSVNFHQPQDPGHAFILDHAIERRIPRRHSHPQLSAVPLPCCPRVAFRGGRRPVCAASQPCWSRPDIHVTTRTAIEVEAPPLRLRPHTWGLSEPAARLAIYRTLCGQHVGRVVISSDDDASRR